MIRKGIVASVWCLIAAPALAQDSFINGVTISDFNSLQADLFVSGVTVLDDKVCMGVSCNSFQTFDVDTAITVSDNRTTSILFNDFSIGAFPKRDWRLRINDNASTATGGLERFSIEDITSMAIPFTVEGGAPSNAMWIASDGRLGLGTAMPQADLHIVDSSDPMIRMEQDTSTGQPGYRWDILGNEAGFAIRDTAGSFGLPLNIEAGAPSQSLFIEDTGQIGLGTLTPEQKLHIRTSTNDTDAFALFDAAGTGSDAAFLLRQQGVVPTTWEFRNQETSGRLNVGIAGGNTPFKIDDAANNNLLRLGLNGQPDAVSVTGRLLVNNAQLNVPDYVFDDAYALRPLSEVSAFIDTHKHLPDVPSAAQIAAQGVDMTDMQMALLKKIEELTLYTLDLEAARAEQQERVAAQQQQIDTLQDQMAQLLQRPAPQEDPR